MVSFIGASRWILLALVSAFKVFLLSYANCVPGCSFIFKPKTAAIIQKLTDYIHISRRYTPLFTVFSSIFGVQQLLREKSSCIGAKKKCYVRRIVIKS